MGKRVLAIKKEVDLAGIRQALGPKCACYVLITCSEPAEDGKMEVEMNFEGDEHLAAFLVENASQVFETRASLRESK